MKKFYPLLFILLFSLGLHAQVDMSYYLPKGVTYDKTIPSPEEVLGYVPGEWHVSHDQILYYMRSIAAASDRITLSTQGHSYEGRPQLLLTVTHPDNHARIESIRAEHLKLSDASQSASVDIENLPAVVWMGYSIHGNEPSGANASLVMIYHLAAAQGAEIEDKLKNTVILFDPSFNPDGIHRFSTWVNMHKSKNISSDPNDREYDEPYPGGRTNHYWFDLNRDWMPVQLAESQSRIKTYHAWKPNVLTDHHEMGTNSTFFFQPGVPSRTHPFTPQKNQDLTAKIGTYHASYLDQIQSLYYSQEGFDDFYYGKGSTFPDINGGIGILFEQASSRGHAQESINGVLTFPFTIRNQFTASLSTWQAVYEMRVELNAYMREFYQGAARDANADANKAILFGAPKDPARAYHLAELLDRHQVEVYHLKEAVTRGGKTYAPGQSFVIPMNQRDYRMIKGMFDERTTFTDSIFYDISAWNYLMAFNMDYEKLPANGYSSNMLGKAFDMNTDFPKGARIGGTSDYAYAFEWHGYYAPRAAYRLLSKGVRLRVAHAPFTEGDKTFDYGTVVLPLGIQDLSSSEIEAILDEIAAEDGVQVHAVKTGLTEGINLGSPTFSALREPKIALLVEGPSSSEAGEFWHLMDQRYDIPITKLPVSRFNRASDRYNVLVMVNGNYNGLNKDVLRSWIAGGGVVVANKSALNWLNSNEIARYSYKRAEVDNPEGRPYELQGNYSGAQVTGGAIFEVKMDMTHPLSYGYVNDRMPVFRNSNLMLEKPRNPYASPIKYTPNPLLSGYISKENLKVLGDTPAVVVSGVGGGRVLGFTDTHAFRAFWFGTNKLIMNSIFFGHTISGGTLER
jgi:hypothetical protein